MGFAVVWVCLLTHAELASSLVFISSLCDVMFSVFSCWAGCRVSVSAERRGLVQGGSWNSYGEEVQQRPVWRCLDWFHTRCGLSGVLLCMTLWSIKHRIWKMQKDLGSFQVISLIFMLFFYLTFRSDWVTVFSAAVPVIPHYRGPVRPIWQTTPTSSYHSEFYTVD